MNCQELGVFHCQTLNASCDALVMPYKRSMVVGDMDVRHMVELVWLFATSNEDGYLTIFTTF